MNRSRVAALLRELAKEFEAPDEEKQEIPEPRPLTDITIARARKILRKRNLAV